MEEKEAYKGKGIRYIIVYSIHEVKSGGLGEGRESISGGVETTVEEDDK